MDIKKIRPLFNAVVTTTTSYKESELKIGGIIDSSKIQMPIKEYQTVVAIGPTVKGINVGDLVKINPSRYIVRKYKEDSVKNDINSYNPVDEYRFKTVVMNGEKYLLLYDSDIEYVIEEFEEEPQSDIIVPSNDLLI